MRRLAASLAPLLATLLTIGACTASADDAPAADGPVELRTDGGASSTYRPASAGRVWTANVAFDVCVEEGAEATVRSLEVNGARVEPGGPVTGYLYVDDQAGSRGFSALTGDPLRLFREHGGTATPVEGARLDRPCPRGAPGFGLLVMSITVPPEGFEIRSYGITYEVDGTTHTATNDRWTYVACGTEQPRDMCVPPPG